MITVREYLSEWLTAHSLETKPKTLAGSRWLIDRYVIPRIGSLRMQAVRPGHLSGLYRVERSRSGDRRSWPASPAMRGLTGVRVLPSGGVHRRTAR